MKIKIKLKSDVTVQQPMTSKTWEFGYFVDSIGAGEQKVPHAVVLTEHGEFELVPFYFIKAIGDLAEVIPDCDFCLSSKKQQMDYCPSCGKTLCGRP